MDDDFRNWPLDLHRAIIAFDGPHSLRIALFLDSRILPESQHVVNVPDSAKRIAELETSNA
jgi:hypothetical protein